MTATLSSIIAERASIKETQARATIQLLDEGCTVPFIARYRKEKTGNLDEVAIAAVQIEYNRLQELEKRKQTIINTISEAGALTPDLQERVAMCYDSNELEDIYLPYKPKRRTRAAIARENGLEPLAKILMAQNESDPEGRAKQFLNEKVLTAAEALSGARDIIAEWVNENNRTRNLVRQSFRRYAVIRSRIVKGKESEGEKYRDYFEWQEPLKACPSHRLLAMRRGEKEGYLNVSIVAEDPKLTENINSIFVKGFGASSAQVQLAIADSLKRLVAPSIETEFAQWSKERADRDAIAVFTENLRQLLLAPPLGNVRLLAIDPGYRTGCKVVCLDASGNLLHNETVYPHPPQSDRKVASKKITTLAEAYQIDAIAIGNGTAGRETEQFIKNLTFYKPLNLYVVNEDGASVYSASSVAREEFPQYDVTVRGAVSIGRRLMDPLAELVKIDPKSIGVGQYQHDVDQKELKESLDRVVESAVNSVGVDVNTASRQLLTFVSGLGPQLAQNIIEHRKNHGPFPSRKALLSVPRMGTKSYEQAAGFLRIREGNNPLDNSAVHPESYAVVEKMASDLGIGVDSLIGNGELLKTLDLTRYVTKDAGLPTLTDIAAELTKPGRDPRKQIKVFEFAEGIYRIEDLQTGMELPGIVNNITRFGAFVDIGVKQSGLVHLSELANRFVTDPNEIVKLHQHVKVRVIDIDLSRGRIQLSMKQASKME